MKDIVIADVIKKCGNENNVIVVYMKTDLTFADIVPSMREYIIERYGCKDNIIDIAVKEEVFDSIGNIKKIFEEIYKSGMTIHSNIHGKLEVDILAYALKPFYIKTEYTRSEDKIIIVITDEDIIRSENMYNKKLIYNEELMKEIDFYMNNNSDWR